MTQAYKNVLANHLLKNDTATYLQSPLNYIGGKYKLLPQILPLFPKDIDIFIDLFCGGANVGLNVARRCGVKELILNDSKKELITLLRYLQSHSASEIFSTLWEIIESFSLSNSSKHGYTFYNCDSSKGLSQYNKNGFIRLRKSYNQDKDILKLFVLIIFSFNNQIRFNAKGEFNLPCGKRDFNAKMQEKLRLFILALQTQSIRLLDSDFREVLSSLILQKQDLQKQDLQKQDLQKQDLEEKDMQKQDCDLKQTLSTLTNSKNSKVFVYADPPYLLGSAPYNENKAWMQSDERDLLDLLNELDSKGVYFALSNVLSHKGKEHTILQEWLDSKPHLQVHYLACNYKNANYQTKRLESKEVLITNY